MRVSSLVVAVVTLFSTASFAGPNHWTGLGTGPGFVNSVVADPAEANTAYAVTTAGLYRTRDAGQTWNETNDRVPAGSIRFLLAAPEAPTTLYGTIDSRIYASTDGGNHWSIRGNLGSVYVWTMAFDQGSGTLYAGTTGGTLISTDDGMEWSRVSDLANCVFAISADAAYATCQGAVVRSTDRGHTWQALNSPPYLMSADTSSSSVYRHSLHGVSVSTDRGQTWKDLPLLAGAIRTLRVVGSDVYAATTSGVLHYSESSPSWSPVGGDVAIFDLSITRSLPRRFYAVPDYGVSTLVDGDTTWSAADNGLPAAEAITVDAPANEPSVAYTLAGTHGRLGVFRTTDGGLNWQQVRPRGGYGEQIVADPANADVAYVGEQGGLLKTSDRGLTWKSVNPNFASALAVAPSDPTKLYAALSNEMEKSTDGGETWTSSMTGLAFDSMDFYYGFEASSLVVSPTDASKVYASKFSGVFNSTNGGASWQKIAPDGWLRAMTIDRKNESILYAAPIAGVVKSTDGGRTWGLAGLLDKFVDSLALAGSRLYAGTADGHLYISDDGAQSWIGFDDGLTNGTVSRVIVDSSGTHLYAATAAGVYAYDIVGQDIRPARLPDDSLRFPRMLDQSISGPAAASIVLPVVGSVAGLSATFTTAVTLVNTRNAAQDILATWLPQLGNPVSFRLTLPASTDPAGGVVKIMDIARSFGMSGIGSLAVEAIDSGGALDSAGSIDGSARIWTHPADDRAPLGQTISAARTEVFANHVHASAAGFRHDAQSRTNLGIVNLSADAHQFTIQINGERASRQVAVAVAPFSLLQLAVPDADYGALSVDVSADASTRWLLYGSSIDRSTGEAETTIGNP